MMSERSRGFCTPSLSMAERNSTARGSITGVDQFRLPAQRTMNQLARARMTEQKIMMLASAKPLSSKASVSIRKVRSEGPVCF